MSYRESTTPEPGKGYACLPAAAGLNTKDGCCKSFGKDVPAGLEPLPYSSEVGACATNVKDGTPRFIGGLLGWEETLAVNAAEAAMALCEQLGLPLELGTDHPREPRVQALLESLGVPVRFAERDKSGGYIQQDAEGFLFTLDRAGNQEQRAGMIAKLFGIRRFREEFIKRFGEGRHLEGAAAAIAIKMENRFGETFALVFLGQYASLEQIAAEKGGPEC